MKNTIGYQRNKHNLSQAELAKILNVDLVTLTDLESNKVDPESPLAFKIAKMFNVAVEDLFDFTDEIGIVVPLKPKPRKRKIVK